ncbi:hypothetical protein BD779DRAFT_1480630 [Infundibulicybe gibba]|nr:hypothetical protein BD779DRAFT_1480630 [Infundibulicybe gibba]
MSLFHSAPRVWHIARGSTIPLGPSDTPDLAFPRASMWQSPGSRQAQTPRTLAPGVWHPSLLLRPDWWIEPSLQDPLPPPSQCQLNPFLQHIQYSPAPLCWGIGQPPTGVLCGQTKAAVPLLPADKARPTTFPFLPEVHICAVAEDIFTVVYKSFRRHVSEAEVAMWSFLQCKQASVVFHARFGHGIQEEMRRIDYFGQYIMFCGLEPHPSGWGWVLFLGLA